MSIYEQEIRAMKENLAGFQEQAWGMLIAHMQSGKTNTFLLTACEMMRSGKVDRAVIFTGCRETDLRTQLNDDKLKFKELYQLFLHSQGVEGRELISGGSFVDNISIYFGQDLDKCEAQDKTLYIWEESHYGQSQKQEVDLFLRRMGIQATGILPGNCFMLSVSATPFSELSDHHHMTQDKFLVRLIPSDQYLSVKKMMANGQIRTMKDPVKELATILRHVQDGYVLIRASKTQQTKMTSIAIAAGFEVVHCDMDHNYDINKKLKNLPLKKTLIFIKGMCRMGKKLDKTHLRVCVETSCGKTDTLLQSLIGRVCGYNSRTDIFIYVKNLPLDELEKYNRLHEGELTSIPSKAMNVVHNTKTRVPIKPLRFKVGQQPDELLVENVLESLSHLEHDNSPETMAIVLPIIRRICSEVKAGNSEHWKAHGKNRNGKRNKIYTATFKQVEEAWGKKEAKCKFGYGAGASDTEDEVIVWESDRYIYITMQIEMESVPVTTKKEVFCRETLGGGAMFHVSPLTRKQPDELEKTINAFIEASRELDVPVLTSNGYGEHMLLTEQVFEHLKTIIKKWKSQGVTITVKKVAGRKPAGLTDIRIAEITWTKPPHLSSVAEHLLESGQ